ncbi:MAG: AMP-binding protein [Gammaproteobacteria bacterium]|nr:AMP-binding protein [Gammaproteobacteria bacterium]
MHDTPSPESPTESPTESPNRSRDAELIEAGYELGWAGARYAEHTALRHGDLHMTFAKVDAAANRLANALRGIGLATNDRVAVLLGNSAHSIITQLGIAKAGLTLVSLNARHSALEQCQIIEDCGPRVVIAGPGFEDSIGEAIAPLAAPPEVLGIGWRGSELGSYESLTERATDSPPRVLVDPERDIIRLFYTSGTTGTPKGIVYTHAQYYARLRNFFSALEYALGTEHSMVHVGPLTHAAGNYVIPYLMRGACSIILEHFDPDELLDTIEREHANHLLLVPTMITRLLEHIRLGAHDLSSISRINYGTAPIPVKTLGHALDVFGPVFRQHYGLSECPQPVTILYPHEHRVEEAASTDSPLASCGRPVVHLDVRIVADQGPTRQADTVGEIVIKARGAAATDIWGRPDLRDQTIRDGWLHTGDLGRFDGRGYLHIVGRNKDMIITGGFNVYAREVEEALQHHPAVLEAAVFGLPDSEWGESICAYVACKSGQSVSPAALVDHCRAQIASYKKPRHLVVLDQLPKNVNGKLDKNAMREHFVRAHGEDPASLRNSVLARY